MMPEQQPMMPEQQPMMPEQQPMMPKMAKVDPGSKLDNLLRAKEDSDNKRYNDKHERMRSLMWQHPQDFHIDSQEGEIYGIYHKPTKFKMHLPKHVVADLGLEDISNKSVTDKARDVLGLQYKEAKIQRFQQDPDSEFRTVETKITSDGQELDVTRLNKLVGGRASEKVSLEDIKTDGNRSKSTGFGSKRYENADTSKPILVDTDNNILDGRHRYYKLLDNGRKTTKVIRVSEEDIASAYTDNNTPDYDNS